MTQQPVQAHKPTALYTIMMMGRPASGKTTVAARLAQSLAIPHILMAKYKRLAINRQYTPHDSLREDLRDYSLERGIEAALETLRGGQPAILDSSFHKLKRRQRVYGSLGGVCPLLVIIYCLSSDIEETRRRIQARIGHENDARHQASDFAIYEYLDRTFDEPHSAEFGAFSQQVSRFDIDTFRRRLPLKPGVSQKERFPVLRDIEDCLLELLSEPASRA